MVNVAIVLLVIVLIVVIGLLIWLSINTAQRVQDQLENNPVIDNIDTCVRSTNDLIDIEKLPCCCVGGFANDNRYVPKLNAVVGPTPVAYLDACAGFCSNSSYDPSSETCTNGSSNEFKNCIELIKPADCKGPAFPVAVIGIQPYYIQFATDEACKISSLCAPNPSNCVIPTGLDGVISQVDS